MKKLVTILFTVVLSVQNFTAQEIIPTIYAHRGGAYELDENTLSAFQTSYDHGLRGFEIDVHFTKDHEIVIIHDHTIDRTINGSGTVEEMTAAELRKLKTKKGNNIMFLDEALNFFNKYPDLYVEFEMKTRTDYYTQEITEKFASQLYQNVFKNMPTKATYLITSFDKRPLQFLESKYKTPNLLFITSKPLSDEVLKEASAMGIHRIGCNLGGTSRTMVKKAQEQGFLISVWPGKNINDFLLGYALGANYLCTDIPLEVYNFIKNQARWIEFK